MNSGPQLNGGTEVSASHSRLLGAFERLGMVSAYHAHHKVEHGREQHPTYRHKQAGSEPWHIDFCFVPGVWAEHIEDVRLLDDESWRRESDHHPLVVDLRFD